MFIPTKTSRNVNCGSAAVFSRFTGLNDDSGILLFLGVVGLMRISLMKHISPLIQGVLLERFVLIVRQHFGGMRHHRFWLQRQNMDVCPHTAPAGAVRP